jgi:hypothetical protein
MGQVHIWPEEPIAADGSTTVGVTIEHPERSRTRLWYRVPVEYSSLISTSCDPFVVGSLMSLMSHSTDVVVHGQVSPSLLQNLTEFQAAWTCWRPNRYRQVEITAEVEREQEPASPADKVVATFSGGVDSCFTVFRHRTGRCGRLRRNIQAGLMVQGFDIPLEQPQVFDRAAQRSRRILASLGVELIVMATNFRELGQDWEDSHGIGVASCMMLLQGGYGAGLIPSTEPYQAVIPWGSNPVTDRLLSSETFQIVHDGAAFTRIQKVEQLGSWSEALQNLRVCWEGQEKDRNCGRCEKCIRTILNFRVVGLGLPRCFEQDVTDRQILSLKGLNSLQIGELEQILLAAKAGSISESWVKALKKCIQQNRQQAALNQLKEKMESRWQGSVKPRLRKMRSRLTRRG